MNLRYLTTMLRRREPIVSLVHGSDCHISGITHDSRAISQGMIFAALPGAKVDGLQFARQAIEAGAVAILTPRRLSLKVPQIVAPFTRRAMAHLADIINGSPTSALDTVGITGTNGKTTCAFLMAHILDHAERSCGLVSTVETRTGKRTFASNMTTPESPDLQSWFAEMRKAGLSAVTMEVSSHALVQERTRAIRFSSALFTNLSQDHLDFHHDMEDYYQAKKRLFDQLPAQAVAVINADDEYGQRLIEERRGAVLSYGVESNAHLRASNIEMDIEGMRFTVSLRGAQEASFSSPLCGSYNIANILGCTGVALALGVGLNTISEAVATFTGAPGRLERVFSANPDAPAVFVDYAHTPDALENVASTLRELCDGRKLITVVGCGGDRDRTKRPLMGGIAARLSDHAFITSDNPRTEDPESILKDVLSGIPGYGIQTSQSARLNKVSAEVDRRQAIHQAIAGASQDDVVLIAGKGHEDYQIIGTEKIDFDDRQVAAEAMLAAELLTPSERLRALEGKEASRQGYQIEERVGA